MNGIGTDSHVSARSYLTRAETRLSTMHRIAGLFVSGAGLLVLFPAFLNDALSVILATSLDPRYRAQMLPCAMWVIVSALLPLYALYLLLKDLVQFYFTAEHPGLKESWFYPRFVLSGIAFSPDEGPDLKRNVYKCQEDESCQYFLLKRKAQKKDQFDALIEATRGEIIPTTRRPDDNIREGDTKDNARRFGAAFGMTGTLDRQLMEEIAKTEVSIVRHALLLRRLVLRYFKALLMFIWTVIVTVSVAAVLRQVEPNQVLTSKRILLISILYALWTLTTPFVVKRPINWIYALGDPDKKQKNLKVTKDPDLQHFENIVRWFCYGSLGLGLLYGALMYYRIIPLWT